MNILEAADIMNYHKLLPNKDKDGGLNCQIVKYLHNFLYDYGFNVDFYNWDVEDLEKLIYRVKQSFIYFCNANEGYKDILVSDDAVKLLCKYGLIREELEERL